MTRPNQGLSSLAPGSKMRGPGNEVAIFPHATHSCLKVLSDLAKPCPEMKNAAAKGKPTTVIFDPSTNGDP